MNPQNHYKRVIVDQTVVYCVASFSFVFWCSEPPGFRSFTDGVGGDADAIVFCGSSLRQISQTAKLLPSHGGNRIYDTADRL